MLKKRDVWIISILVVLSIISIYLLNDFDIGLAPSWAQRGTVPGVNLKQPNCITPPQFPQLITQSGKICSGNYNYGIGIGADNIKIDCNGAVFNGANWNGLNGLSVSGVKNITAEGCSFIGFKGDGVFVGNVTSNTTEINLLNISSKSNNANGVFVGHNVVNLTLEDSNISVNKKDGVMLTSSYVGPVNGGLLFPEGISILYNNIEKNGENGINFDAFDYFVHSFGLSNSRNTSTLVVGNSILNNGKNGIQNLEFFNSYSNAGNSYALLNKINYNMGHGISIVEESSDRVIKEIINLNDKSAVGAVFDFIAYNDILNNQLDGISFYTPLKKSYSIPYGNYFDMRGTLFANHVAGNLRHGVSFTGEDFPSNSFFNYYGGINIFQNDISNNFKENVYLSGLNSSDGSYSHYSIISCNDIRLGGMGNSEGIEINYFEQGYFSITEQNIIESNSIGILFGREKPLELFGFYFDVSFNYIGSNFAGIIINVTNDSIRKNGIGLNDFNLNNLQAFDIDFTEFFNNWWSDYSPTCVDNNPLDGYCDVNRPIPVNNQDVQPKAGFPWGHNARGYFVRANPGVVLKPSCPVPYGMPPRPTRPPKKIGGGNIF